MRGRTFLILLLALASGGLAAMSTLRYLQERATPLLAAEPRTAASQVVVAARSLQVGEVIAEPDVKTIDWPGGAVPVGYARTVGDVVGRGVVLPVTANEPILDTKLADRAAGGGLPILIPEGMRAVSVRVDEVIAVAGFVRPWTRVDVLLTVNQGGGGEPVTRVILQNVQALAAGQQFERDPQGRPVTTTVLTVLVSPEDAEKLTLAAAQGRIQLALRNTVDMREIRTTGARLSHLLTGMAQRPAAARAAAPAPAEDEPRPTTIEVFKGGSRALVQFR